MAYQPLNNQVYQPVDAAGQYSAYAPPSMPSAPVAGQYNQPSYNPAAAPPGQYQPSYAPPGSAPPGIPSGYVAVAVDSQYIQFSQAARQPPAGLPPSQWSDGICDCLDDGNSCLLSFCCPCIRAAYTLDRAALLEFGKALFLFLIPTLAYLGMQSLVFVDHDLQWPGWVLMGVGLLFIIIRTHYRIKIREKYEINGGACEDFLYQCCCPCCALAQEARHVDRCVGLMPINEQRPN